MRKADKRKQLLEGMTHSTKVRWAAKGKTVYAQNEAGFDDYTKPTGFEVERWGFYYKSYPSNEVRWLSPDDLDFLGRRDQKPTGEEDQEVALAYVLFKCITHSDGQVYTRERANRSWFIRFAVEAGFTSQEAEAVLFDIVKSSRIAHLCGLLADHAGIGDLPLTTIEGTIPSAHKMEEVKKVPFSQLILNRMNKHKETRFKDMDG
jgi:hypothetical protein